MKPTTMLAALLTGAAAVAAHAAEAPWPVIGRQGIVRVVIVPEAQARNAQAYERQITLLCGSQPTCFLNFHTNSTGAEAAVPLPDAIAREATAVYRRSQKQAGEFFRWSCRMGIDSENCF